VGLLEESWEDLLIRDILSKGGEESMRETRTRAGFCPRILWSLLLMRASKKSRFKDL